MDAAEAKELGLADEVTKEVKMAANFSLRLLPKAAAERLRAETGTAQEDPPPTATEPERPEEQPPAPPVPTAPEPVTPVLTVTPPADNVITIDGAKQQGIEEHKAYVSSITDLCVLAGALERVGSYVRAGTPVDQVARSCWSFARNRRCAAASVGAASPSGDDLGEHHRQDQRA